MKSIGISRLHYPVTTLGPGRRIGVWLQGCSIRCVGCISPDTWNATSGQTTLEELSSALLQWAPAAEGLTVSGGEPFDQPEALAELLVLWRALSKSDVLVFSGYPYERLSYWIEKHEGLIDALVAGPFIEAEPQTRALKGSDNQTLHLLTTLGRSRFSAFDRPVTDGDKRVDIMFDADGVIWMTGIPGRGDLERLREHLHSHGNLMVLSGKGGAK